MANDLSSRSPYPGYTAGDLVRVHRPGSPNVDYKASPATLKGLLDAAGIDHGNLSGRGDDDHIQYHTDARGDARYYTKAQNDVTVAAINTRLVALEAEGGGGGGGGSAIVWSGYADTDSSLFADGVWGAVPINQELRDLLGITISNGEVTLPAGSYEVYTAAYVYISTDNSQPNYELAIAADVDSVWTPYTPLAYVTQPLSAGSDEDNGVRIELTVTFTLSATTTIRAQVRGIGHAITVKDGAQLIIRNAAVGSGGGAAFPDLADAVPVCDGAGGANGYSDFRYHSALGGLEFPFSIKHISELSNPTWTALASSIQLPSALAHTYITVDNQPASTEVEGSATLTINIPGTAPVIPINTEISFEVTVKNAHASNQLLVLSGAGFTVAEGSIARAMRLLPGASDVFRYRYKNITGGGVWLCEGVPSIKDQFSFFFAKADGSTILAGDVLGQFVPSGIMTVPGWISDIGSALCTPTPTAQQTFDVEERTGGPDTWTKRGELTFASSAWFGIFSFSAPQAASTLPWRIKASSNSTIATVFGFLNVMKKVQF